jgi:hypothetical protein
MQNLKNPLFGLLSLAAATFACGSVSYKLGGTDHEYRAAEERCRGEGRSAGADFERCMQERGWVVKQLDAPAGTSGVKHSPPTGSTPGASRPTPASSFTAPSESGKAPSAAGTTTAQGWFKLGATADEFAAAKARCAARIDRAARPDPESDVVAGELTDCLRGEGWRPLRSH